MWLNCNECNVALKDYNVPRHHIGTAFSRGITGEGRESAGLDCTLQRELYYRGVVVQRPRERYSSILFFCSVSWQRRKGRLETVKDCMLAVADEVINDDRIQTSVTSAIKIVPLSDTSDTCRVEIPSTDVFEMLSEGLE